MAMLWVLSSICFYSEPLSLIALEVITCYKDIIFLQDARKRFDKASLLYDQV